MTPEEELEVHREALRRIRKRITLAVETDSLTEYTGHWVLRVIEAVETFGTDAWGGWPK